MDSIPLAQLVVLTRDKYLPPSAGSGSAARERRIRSEELSEASWPPQDLKESDFLGCANQVEATLEISDGRKGGSREEHESTCNDSG